MKAHIPNSLTILNLIAGIVGIYACATSNYMLVPICMGVSLLADFLDGYVARALNAGSELGKQLDSLADNVTFGVLPGMMLMQLISMSGMSAAGSYDLHPMAFLGLIYAVGACYRLGKFNIDTRQTQSFLGMPTPAGAIFVLGIYMSFFQNAHLAQPGMIFKAVYQPLSMIAITVVLAGLMISELPMFSLKGNFLKWKGNEIRMIFIVLSLAALYFLRYGGFSVIILMYVFFSILQKILVSGNKDA